MSNINRFLNTASGDSFVNDGSINLYVNNVNIAGLESSMPVATDSKKNLISTGLLSVPAGPIIVRGDSATLRANAGPALISGAEGTQLISSDGYPITMFAGSLAGNNPVTIVATDLTLNGSSVVFQESRSSSVSFSTGVDVMPVTIYIQRVGKMVNLFVPRVSFIPTTTSGAMTFDYPTAWADLKPFNLSSSPDTSTTMITWGTVNAVEYFQKIICIGSAPTPPNITFGMSFNASNLTVGLPVVFNAWNYCYFIA